MPVLSTGMAVGHVYYFLEDIFPHQPGGRKILVTPQFLKNLCDPAPEVPVPVPVDGTGASTGTDIGTGTLENLELWYDMVPEPALPHMTLRSFMFIFLSFLVSNGLESSFRKKETHRFSLFFKETFIGRAGTMDS